MAHRFKGLKDVYPFYLANKPISQAKEHLPVLDKYTQQVASKVCLADATAINQAIQHGLKAEESMKHLPNFQRKEILQNIASQIKSREDELATVLAVEVGKTLKEAKIEVARAVDVFTISAEESVRRNGDFSLMGILGILSILQFTIKDISPRNKGFQGLTQHFPVGLVSMIVPFNFPLNLAAHKVGPAIAAGCPFVLKPSERTPISASILGDILSRSGLPDGAFSILPCTTDNAAPFSTDPSIKLLSFTGSVGVGWKLKKDAGKKKVTLELGGNAACIVDKDVINLDNAIDRLVFGAFYQAGQSCISVQRVFVNEAIYDEFKTKIVERTKKLKKGDPFEDSTFVGPLITENDAKRIEGWVNNAIKDGAKLLTGGKRDGVLYDATILENVSRSSELWCKEAFGPVFTLHKFSDFKEAVNMVNDSEFGLQAGVFTQNINKAFYAFQNLHVGGVLINDIPSARVDSQPYGGIKDSGVGREGIRYAIEDFSEIKIMLLKDIGQL